MASLLRTGPAAWRQKLVGAGWRGAPSRARSRARSRGLATRSGPLCSPLRACLASGYSIGGLETQFGSRFEAKSQFVQSQFQKRGLSSDEKNSSGMGDPGFNEEEAKKMIQPILPKKLEDLIIMEKWQDKTAEEIGALWAVYHEKKTDCVSTCLSGTEWNTLLQRAKQCPLFVYPVNKPDKSYYVLLAQWESNHCVVTYLEDFKKDPANAVPYFYLCAYDNFAAEKDTVLVRAEHLPYLTKLEADALLQDIFAFYVRDDLKFEHVETFNLNPQDFDFATVFGIVNS